MVILSFFFSCGSSGGGLHGEEEPGAEAEQPASCQDGLGADAALHPPPGVRRVLESQVPRKKYSTSFPSFP